MEGFAVGGLRLVRMHNGVNGKTSDSLNKARTASERTKAKTKVVPLPALPLGMGRAAAAGGSEGAEAEGGSENRRSSRDEKDAASTLASLFSSAASSSDSASGDAAAAAKSDPEKAREETCEDMDEDEDSYDEALEETGTRCDGDDKKPQAAAAKGKRAVASGGGAPLAKKPHAMVDHTYTDYSVVDEDLLAEIDRRVKVLSDAGDVVKFIEEAERSVWTRGGSAGGAAGLGPRGRILSEAEQRERQEKMEKLQKMLNGKLGGPRRNSGGVAQPFPLKLMEVLDLEEYEHVASWMPHGRAFIVHNPKVFTAEILPRFFKQTKFMSFTRQLNLWGFKRITRRGNPDVGAYYHELFLRGRPRLSTRMRREKIKGTGIKLSPNPDAEPDFYKMAEERPLVNPGEEARVAEVGSGGAAKAVITASPAVVPQLPSFPIATAAGGTPLLGSTIQAATGMLRQSSDLNQFQLVEQMKALDAAREEQRKLSTERVAIEYAAAFAAKQQQQAAAATALATRAAQCPQDATVILGQLLVLNGSGGGQAPPTSAVLPPTDLSGINTTMNLTDASRNPGAATASINSTQPQLPNTQELLRKLQSQSAAPTFDPLLLRRTAAGGGSGDAAPTAAASMSGSQPQQANAQELLRKLQRQNDIQQQQLLSTPAASDSGLLGRATFGGGNGDAAPTAAASMNSPQPQQPNAQELLRKLQQQTQQQQQLLPAAATADPLLLGSAGGGRSNGDALAAIAARISGSGGGGGANGSALLSPPDPVLSAAAAAKSSSPPPGSVAAPSRSTEAALLRTLLAERQQQEAAGRGGGGGVGQPPFSSNPPTQPFASTGNGGGGAGVGLPPDLLAAMAIRQGAGEVVNNQTGDAGSSYGGLTGGGEGGGGDPAANAPNLSALLGSGSLLHLQRQQAEERLKVMARMGWKN